MPTITVSDESGQLTIAADGGQPKPVESVEMACTVIEQAFGQVEQPEPQQQMDSQQFQAGFDGVRGPGLGR